MAIINKNQVTLSDSKLTLDTTMISAHTSEISNNSATAVKVRCQLGFFLDAETMLASPTNALKVVGFEGNKNVLIFDYPTDDRNVFWFFDLRIKEYLMELFPAWNPDLLIVTTDPDFVMPE